MPDDLEAQLCPAGRSGRVEYYVASAAGPGGDWRTYWDPPGNDYGMLVMSYLIPVRDAVAYGGMAHSQGFCMAREFAVGFMEYDPQVEGHTAPTGANGALDGHRFPGASTTIASCME